MRIIGSTKSGIIMIGIIAVSVLCMLYGFSIVKPTGLPKDTAAQESFQETMDHLKIIAKEPHATGSLTNQEVRKYLTDCFEGLQIEYESISFQQGGKTYVDYLVKLDAPDTDEGVMFVSHYDSVHSGPGAADDGISVASMLTALESSVKSQHKNDLYYLFTDGEELGLIGADYFVREYKATYIDKLKLIVNLEARGNQGPLLMFETSKDNYKIARMLQRAVPSGSTPFSFAAALYKTMPNDTDLTRFLEAGFEGMNFAVVKGGENYHTKQDSVENLGTDTAYMYYATVSELTSYLGSMDLKLLDCEEEGVYFPVARGKFFLCTEKGMALFSIITLCFFIYIAGYTLVKKRIRFDKVVLSLSMFGLYLVASYGVLLLVRFINSKMVEGTTKGLQEIMIPNQSTYLIQIIIMGVLGLLIYILVGKHLRLQEHLLCWGIFFSILCIMFYFLFHAIIYLFSIIVFIITLMLVFTVVYRGRITKWLLPVLAGILCLFCTVLYIPIMTTIYDAILYIQDVFITALVLGVVEAILFGLCLGCFVLSFQVNPVSFTERTGRTGQRAIWNQLIKIVRRES